LNLLILATRAAIRRPWRVLAAAAFVCAVCVALAIRLEIRSSFEELLPADLPSVAQIKELSRRLGGDGNVLVNVESLDGPAELGRARALVPVLAQELLALGPDQVRSVEYETTAIQAWYQEHWPLFATVEELTAARDAVHEEVRRRTAEANPLVVALEDREPARKAEGRLSQLLDPAQPLPRDQIARRFAQNEGGFLTHPDRSSVTILVRPAGSSLSVSQTRALLDEMQSVADRHATELAEQRLRIGFGGTLPLFVAEYEAVVGDVGTTALLCTTLILLSVVAFFRDVRSVLTVSLCVAAAIAVTFGLTWLTIGYLNAQTAFLGSIVVGNGINYGLIYLARVKQRRRAGVPLLAACEDGARTTARATLLASAATAVSFGVLVVAANRGFRHFGIIGGMGMLLCWLATFTLAPAILSVLERVRPVAPAVAAERSGLPRVLEALFSRPAALIAGFAALSLAAAAIFLAWSPRAMERNLENLSNDLRGVAELRRDHSRGQAALGKSIAGSVALLESSEEAAQFCAVIRQRMQEPRYSSLIDGCETVFSVVPDRQGEKLALLEEIAAAIPERTLAHADSPTRERLAAIRADLLAQSPVAAEEAPSSLLDRFRERDGSLGRIAVITARSDAQLELGPNLQAFVEAGRDVPVNGRTVDASGENVIFADLLRNIENEGPRATLLSFFGVCAVVLLVFRDAGLSAHVTAALSAGVLLMAGVTAAADFKINFFNFIAYPITFGIAVDYGANVAARVRERSGAILESIVEVGPAVVLCSWTTMIGYGSLLLSINRALRSFGWYAIIGEATTLLTALLLLPALLLVRRSRVWRPGASAAPQAE
jgi:uncharacterized protein